MELALSLGDASKPSFPNFLEKPQKRVKDLGFCMALGQAMTTTPLRHQSQNHGGEGEGEGKGDEKEEKERRVSLDRPVQLDLLPFSPVPRPQQPSTSQPRLPWITDNCM